MVCGIVSHGPIPPSQTPAAACAAVEALRRQRYTGMQIASEGFGVRRWNFIATIDSMADAAVCFCHSLLTRAACAQMPPGQVLNAAIPPGTNYEKAEFRLWYLDKATFIRAVLVLMPGSNADGRPDVNDRFWQSF